MNEGGSNKPGERVSAPVPAEPLARARPRPCKALAEQFAVELAKPHSHQLGACARLRVSYAAYKRWMAAEPKEDEEDLADFQAIVLEALDEARVRDIEDLEVEFARVKTGKSGALINKHTFHHGQRFKRFYANDEEPKESKVQLSGPDGKPIQTDNKHEHRAAKGLSKDVARVLALKVLGIPEHLLPKPLATAAPPGEPGTTSGA